MGTDGKQLPYRSTTRFIIVVYSIILMLSLLCAFMGGNVPGTDKALVTLGEKDFTPDMKATVLKNSTSDLFVYEAQFDKTKEFEKHECAGILIPRLASNGYKVYLNGMLIGQNGSTERRLSNIWNTSSFMPFPEQLLKAHNNIKIISRAEYMTGLANYKVYIMPYENGVAFQNQYVLFNHVVIYVGMGVLLISTAILLIMFMISERNRLAYFYMAVGMIFIMIYSMDYVPLLEMPLQYFTYKKIIMISYWTTTLLYGLGMGRLFKTRLPIITGVAGWIGILLIALFSRDMTSFKHMYTLWYPTQMLNVFIWIIAAARKYRTTMEGKVFLLGFSLLAIYSMFNLVLDMSGGSFSMNSPIIYMAVCAIIPLMVVHFDVLSRKFQLRSEAERRKRADFLANRDALTEAYNKRYFMKLVHEFASPYTIVMFDVDDFKLINDGYGHQAGDETLVYIVEKLHQYLRKDDILCRIGGDEFAVLLPVPMNIAEKRIEAFRRDISQNKMKYLNSEIAFTLSFGMDHVEQGDDVDTCIRLADQALYESKQKGKNQITVYRKPD